MKINVPSKTVMNPTKEVDKNFLMLQNASPFRMALQRCSDLDQVARRKQPDGQV